MSYFDYSSSPPEAQGAYVVGNKYYQNVWYSATNCKEYSRNLDENGNPTGAQTEIACQTTVPPGSTGPIRTYTAFVSGEHLREALWRGDKGYVRNVHLNSSNTGVNWAAAPAWSQCCGPTTAPEAQAGFVVSHD